MSTQRVLTRLRTSVRRPKPEPGERPVKPWSRPTNTVDVLGRPLQPGGKVLFHEHLQFGWPGFALDFRARQSTDLEVATATADELVAAGYSTFVDATPIECGRDLGLMAALARRTRLQFVSSAGIYEQTRGFPTHLASLSVDELVELYSHDMQEGENGGRAGVIKVATRRPPYSKREEKAVEAAGITAARLGVTIITHAVTLDNARRQLEILSRVGADPHRIVLGHLDDPSNSAEELAALAREGVFIGLDRFGHGTIADDERRVELIRQLREAGVFDSLLISHDTRLTFLGRLEVGEPGINPFLHIENNAVPLLRARGFSDEDMHRLLVDNPQRLLMAPVSPAAARG